MFGFTDLIIDEGDVNQNQLPRGGIIVFAASTPGQGYAPFKGAKVRVTTGKDGAITGITGISTTREFIDVESVDYDKITGLATVSTTKVHRFGVEDFAKLVGLEFTCPTSGYPSGITTLGITSFVYDHIVGIATIITDSTHGFTDPNLVGIVTDGLTFTCDMDGYRTNHTYPRSTDPANNKFLEIRNVTRDEFDVNVGISTQVRYTPVDAVYDAVAGIMTVTIGSHDIMSGTSIKIDQESINFQCAMDGLLQLSHILEQLIHIDGPVASTTATGIAITVGTSIVNYSITTAITIHQQVL